MTAPEKLQKYLQECGSLNIEVVPPSIKNGKYSFTAKDGKIIFGLKGIKGIGSKISQQIAIENYENFEDFCCKAHPNSSVLVALAESGVFDEFGYGRNQIIQSASYISDLIKKSKKSINPKAVSLFNNKPSFNIPVATELPSDVLADKEYERLNTYLKYNPLSGVELETPDELKGDIFIEGYITSLTERITKKEQLMATLNVASNLGPIKTLIFPTLYREKKNILRKNIYVAIRGEYKENNLLAKNIWQKQ